MKVHLILLFYRVLGSICRRERSAWVPEDVRSVRAFEVRNFQNCLAIRLTVFERSFYLLSSSKWIVFPVFYQLEVNSVFRSYSRSQLRQMPYSFWKRLTLPLSSRIPLCSAVRRAFPMYTMSSGGLPELFPPTTFIRWTEFSGVLPELLLATTSIWCTDFSGVLPELSLSTTFVPRFPSGLGCVTIFVSGRRPHLLS